MLSNFSPVAEWVHSPPMKFCTVFFIVRLPRSDN
jgi:hypothetical protein